jgi:hypothetical protein
MLILRKNKQVTSATKFLRPFGIKNFNEFLKKNFFFGNETLNRQNFTLPKAKLLLKIIHTKVCQISALVEFK